MQWFTENPNISRRARRERWWERRRDFVVVDCPRIAGTPGLFASRMMDLLVFHWFYRGSWITVRFCSCRQGPNWCRSVPAERCFKKTKEFQCFSWDAKYGSLEVQAGISSPSRGRVAGNVVFRWFYKGSRLTVRFPGAQFFLASTKSLFLQWFCSISECGVFFGQLHSKGLET